MTFSSGALVIVSGLLAALSATVVALFKLLLTSKDTQIVALTLERDALRAEDHARNGHAPATVEALAAQ